VVADTALTPPPLGALSGTNGSAAAATPPATVTSVAKKPAGPAAPGAAAGAAATAAPAGAAAVKTSDGLAEQIKVARAKLDARLYDQALTDVRGGLAANPSSAAAPSAHLLLGTIFERQGRADDAMAAYVELRSRYAGTAEAAEGTLQLASLMLQSRRDDRENTARNLLSEVTQMPGAGDFAPQALVRRAALEDRSRMRVADAALGTMVPASLISFRQLVDSYPAAAGVDVALARLGEMYDDLKRYDLAGQALFELARRFPNTTTDAAWRAGELFEKRVKDLQRAREAYALVPPRSEHYRDAQKKLQP
jgi:TolA-binding protein